jgi:hypothetical protein
MKRVIFFFKKKVKKKVNNIININILSISQKYIFFDFK